MIKKTTNSREYWDCRFDSDWNDKGGSEQTRYFTNLAISLLPTILKNKIREHKLSVLDWGCAQGEGTDILAQEFPQCEVHGLDFSSVAIDKGRQKFPNIHFMAGTLERFDVQYDVMYSSNCLEHFDNPIQVMSSLLKKTKHMLILLLPFEESPRISEHFATFDYTSFRLVMDDSILGFQQEYDTSPDQPCYWPGKQIVLVYVKKDSILVNQLGLDIFIQTNKELATLRQDVARKVNIVNEFQQQIGQQKVQICEQERLVNVLTHRLEQKEQLLGEQNEQISQLEQKISEQKIQLEQLKLQDERLNLILNSSGWHALLKYYRVRDSLFPEKSLRREMLKKSVRLLTKINSRNVIPTSEESCLEDRAIELSSEKDIENFPTPEIPTDSSKIDILCFPIIDWNFRFQRPQQLMTILAQRGHRVFYFTTTFNRVRSNARPSIEYSQITPNIWEIKVCVVNKVNIYQDEPRGEDLEMLLKSLLEIRARFGITSAVSVVDLPFWNDVAFSLRRQFGWNIVYDCMDQHSGFSTNEKGMLSKEETLVKDADLVVTTAKRLFDDKSKLSCNTVLIPNAGDYRHFSQPCQSWQPEFPLGPVIGYFGAISDWFDSELITYLARRHLNWQFMLIGSTAGANIQELDKCRNVHLMGEKPYKDLPMYLSIFDVAIIPFKINELTKATNPVKFFEYIAAGKPVVSTNLPELVTYHDYLYLAEDKVQFETMVEKALAEEQGSGIQEKRIAVAKENTWNNRADLLEGAITNLYPIASIIIVTYNNLVLTQKCIDSIYANTAYPNYEIIIVDNDSKDGTQSYLEKLNEEKPNLRIILNEDNLGFAKANNQGLKVAQGEYLVLLNNDTMVTRGWLETLLSHLSDKDIGLVGPVTNSIGNEAKIEVSYINTDEINSFAWKYCVRNHGKIFEIPMLAMFCLAMRRQVFLDVGDLDERFGLGMFEDDDYSYRVKLAGLKVVCAEDAFVHHFGGASFGKLEDSKYRSIFEENKRRFEKKWDIKWWPHRYRKE